MSSWSQLGRIAFVFSVLATACIAQCAAGEPTPMCAGCNIVLISIDTLRADHLPCYGYQRDTAPFLCELAARGLLFENCTNPGGGTLPVHMSMMTGLYPAVHGVVSHTDDERLDERRITLAEQLESAGYRRVAYTDGGLTSAHFGFDQGFEIYDDSGRGLAGTLPKARKWLSSHDGERFFMFLHTYDVHSERSGAMLPYAPPVEYRNLFGPKSDLCTRHKCGTQLLLNINERIEKDGFDAAARIPEEHLERIVGLYDGGIRYVDDLLKGFLADLEERDLLARTVVVITSDHGEEFLEHGYFLHTGTQYSELTHIPLILLVPGVEAARVKHLVSTIDLMPTLLDLVGVEVTDEAQGHSMLPAVIADQPIREAAFLGLSVRTSEWKRFPERDELFRCADDPGDRVNLIAQQQAVGARLDELFRTLAAANRELQGSLPTQADDGEGAVVDEKLRDELRALGYIK